MKNTFMHFSSDPRAALYRRMKRLEMDLKTRCLGENARRKIEEQISQCRVLLVRSSNNSLSFTHWT